MAAEAKLRETTEERSFWEQMAVEADQAKVVLEKKLNAQQAHAAEQPRTEVSAFVAAAETAAQAVELDEADTRKLIDAQLAQAGWRVDHEPPVQVTTSLSQKGIVWKVGEKVERYHARRNERDLFTTPDEIKIEVEDFNRRVITESFNRTVCDYLATELDPSSRQKTLIFCVNDAHADLAVDLLKKSFQAQYGSVDDDAVMKITGAADNPLQLIRRYKHERMPNVAVTVDLLTTGVDVPGPQVARTGAESPTTMRPT
jgi:type I site-specific restriction endonuclease